MPVCWCSTSSAAMSRLSPGSNPASSLMPAPPLVLGLLTLVADAGCNPAAPHHRQAVAAHAHLLHLVALLAPAGALHACTSNDRPVRRWISPNCSSVIGTMSGASDPVNSQSPTVWSPGIRPTSARTACAWTFQGLPFSLPSSSHQATTPNVVATPSMYPPT